MATTERYAHTESGASPFYLQLADKVFRVRPLTGCLEEICHAYILDGSVLSYTPQIAGSIELTPADIDAARARSNRPSTDAQFEELVLYHKITDELLAYDTILFHASCIAVDGIGYLFTAPSGTGKSTHTSLWRERFGERAVMVNDDKPYICLTDNGVMAYGSPWSGGHHLNTNIGVPVRALSLLERAETDHIEPITAEEAFPALYARTYHPNSEALTRHVLSLIDRLTQQVKLFRLGCTMDADAARMSYETMSAVGEDIS